MDKNEDEGRARASNVRESRPARLPYATPRDPNYNTLKLRLEGAHVLR